MRVRTVAYVALLVLLGLFVLANWPQLSTPVEVNLLATTLFVPGAILAIALLGLVMLVDWGVHAAHRLAWSRERRALETEIQRLRTQESELEASRDRALRELIQQESASLRAQIEALRREDLVGRPVVHVEEPLRTAYPVTKGRTQ